MSNWTITFMKFWFRGQTNPRSPRIRIRNENKWNHSSISIWLFYDLSTSLPCQHLIKFSKHRTVLMFTQYFHWVSVRENNKYFIKLSYTVVLIAVYVRNERIYWCMNMTIDNKDKNNHSHWTIQNIYYSGQVLNKL